MICIRTGICHVAKFKTRQIVLGTDLPNLMLAKVSRYTVWSHLWASHSKPSPQAVFHTLMSFLKSSNLGLSSPPCQLEDSPYSSLLLATFSPNVEDKVLTKTHNIHKPVNRSVNNSCKRGLFLHMFTSVLTLSPGYHVFGKICVEG